jgi:hypothetical protein
MRFASESARVRRSFHAAFALVAIAAMPACGSNGSSADASAPSSGADAGSDGEQPTIAYDGSSPIELSPGDVATLEFTVSPAASQLVRFAIVGDAGDASLDEDVATTAPDGHVAAKLTAASTSRTFGVRATVSDGASIEVAVSVSGSGFGAVEIVPSYAGKRAITTWVGTVATGATCAALSGTPPTDGPLASAAAPPGHPTIASVPVGPALVVTARAGHFAGGCVDVTGLAAGELRKVTVPVLDRPIDLSGTTLSVALSIESSPSAWGALLSEATSAAAEAFRPDGTTDATALLDAMHDALPAADEAGFADARTAGSWDDALATYLSAQGVSPRQLVQTWLQAGADELDIGAGLRGQVHPGANAGEGWYALESFVGLAAAEVGIGVWNGVTWTADAGDVLHLGGSLSFPPASLVAAAAVKPAKLAHPTANGVAAAVAEAISCTDAANKLTAGATAVPGCDAACLAKACSDGLDAMWTRVGSATSLGTAKLAVTASGPATVGDEAQPIGLDGTWVGAITLGPLSIALKGSATGHP